MSYSNAIVIPTSLRECCFFFIVQRLLLLLVPAPLVRALDGLNAAIKRLLSSEDAIAAGVRPSRRA